MNKLNPLGFRLPISIIKTALAAWLGALVGSILSILVVTGFAIVILSEFLNIYYSVFFFVIGSYYSYKIFKKNQIMLQLDNDFASRGLGAPGPTDTSSGLFRNHKSMAAGHPLGPGRNSWKNLPDRFLHGGNEQQPEGYKSSKDGAKEYAEGSQASMEGLEFSNRNQDNDSDDEESGTYQ